jgi:NAD(P)-dependent dehydrogenase (short-subunit alcohol dehydrogenase family)
VTAEIAVIVGAGAGLSAALARGCAREGMRVVLAARNTEKLAGLAGETKARVIACDAGDRKQVGALFRAVADELGVPQLVVFNASRRVRGPFLDLDAGEVERALAITAFAGFLVGQAAARLMVPAGTGSIFFTGASASVKGYPQSATFAMGKFALRGLAQSMARELGPKGLHIAHFVIDGGISRGPQDERNRGNDGLLDPAAIAQTYLDVHRQARSAWSLEVELRPWVEPF